MLQAQLATKSRFSLAASMGATHTFMWVGKRVQREARNHDRPSGNAFRRGEPTSNEYANADENEPKRVVDVGGRSPGARAKRGSPLGGSGVQPDGAAAPRAGKYRR